MRTILKKRYSMLVMTTSSIVRIVKNLTHYISRTCVRALRFEISSESRVNSNIDFRWVYGNIGQCTWKRKSTDRIHMMRKKTQTPTLEHNVPNLSAISNGVSPFSFRMFKSAPKWSKHDATWGRPKAKAQCKGVVPVFERLCFEYSSSSSSLHDSSVGFSCGMSEFDWVWPHSNTIAYPNNYRTKKRYSEVLEI